MKINMEFKTNKLWESLVGLLAFLMFLLPIGYVSTLLGKSNLSLFILGVSVFIIIIFLRYFFPNEYSLKVMYWPTVLFIVIPNLSGGGFGLLNSLLSNSPSPDIMWYLAFISFPAFVLVSILGNLLFTVLIVWSLVAIEKKLRGKETIPFIVKQS